MKNTLEIGMTLYCTKDCIEKGIQAVTVTRIENGVCWADNDGYPYKNSFWGDNSGCLLRALFIGHNAFFTKEEAIAKAKKEYELQINSLKRKLEGEISRLTHLASNLD